MSDWISKPTSGYGGLTESEQENNARIIWGDLSAAGFTLNSICGMLGNMSQESGLNPQAWQTLNNPKGGMGLVQWTPATKLIVWCNNRGINYKDGDSQLSRILYEFANDIQYISTSDYPLSASDFMSSTQSPEYLTRAFFANYERGNPAKANMDYRISRANYYYTLFSGQEPPEPGPGPEPGRGMTLPFWMLYKMSRRFKWYLL